MKEISIDKRLVLKDLRRQRRFRLATDLIIDVTNPAIIGKFITLRDVDLELDCQLAQLPLGLLQFVAQNVGIIEVWNRTSVYNPRTRIAHVRLIHLAQRTGVLHEEVLHLADHLLGSLADPIIPKRMSQGYGINKKIQSIGEQIGILYASHSEFRVLSGSFNEREYFARAGRWYLLDADFLKEADPTIFELLGDTIFCETFWMEVLES
ncbi:hypothetical protein H8E77_01735 [bacterium]|nr:hypothetical protein [bacterium]